MQAAPTERYHLFTVQDLRLWVKDEDVVMFRAHQGGELHPGLPVLGVGRQIELGLLVVFKIIQGALLR